MADDHDIQIHDAWGIGNLRQTAGFPIGNENKYHYVCPVGPLLVIWDIMKKKRVEAKQLVDDLITILHKCEKTKFALLISYSGNGILLSPSLKPLSHFAVPGNNVVYASWSACGKYFCVCNIGHFSSLRLYAIEADGSSAILNWCVKASDIEGLEACATSEDGTHSLEQSGLVDEWQIKDALSSKAGHMDAYYGCVFTDNQKLIAIYKHDRNPCEAHLYSYDGVLLKRCTISPLGEPNTSMLCMSECRKMTCAIGLHRGLFVFIDLENFELKSIFQAQGSAQVCIWEKDLLVTASYQSGLLQWWSVCGDLVKEMEIEKIDSVVHLNWSVLEKELWIGGITSLNYTFFESTESDNKKLSKTVSFFDHTVAGCGLNFKDQFSLATGDLAGNVIINKLGRHPNFHNENRVNVKNSVRCLAWIDDDLFIGTLEGMLFCWQPFKHSEGTQLFNVAHVFDFGVLTLRKANTSNRLAVGTGGGDLFIFDTRSGTCDLVLHRKVHACKAIVDGTGIQPMEIWSLAWDPTDKMIVTASEDQTSIVLSIIKGSCFFAKI